MMLASNIHDTEQAQFGVFGCSFYKFEGKNNHFIGDFCKLQMKIGHFYLSIKI
jgi:hypothetical protein